MKLRVLSSLLPCYGTALLGLGLVIGYDKAAHLTAVVVVFARLNVFFIAKVWAWESCLPG